MKVVWAWSSRTVKIYIIWVAEIYVRLKACLVTYRIKEGKNDGRWEGFETCQDLKCKQNEATGMITEEDKDTIRRCAKRYNVESVTLFGSSTRDDIESNDIDIGVKGVDPAILLP